MQAKNLSPHRAWSWLHRLTGRCLRFTSVLWALLGLAGILLAAPAPQLVRGEDPASPAPEVPAGLYRDAAAPPEARAEDLLGRLTLDEKILLLGGDSYIGTPGVPRLGIPPLLMTDGPLGTRHHGKSTAYPGGVALAASWNVDLAHRVGVSLGRDCRARGVHILLAPGMNLYRSPVAGRNFEYLGEDPLLAGQMAAAYIRGVQSQGVATTAKHFIANEQELDRKWLSSEVDERTLRELYMKPFRMCVEAGTWAVMTSNNPVNGVHASENDWLINTVLKGEWGYRGFVVSDWQSTYNALNMSKGGLDLEMPLGKFFNKEALLPLVESGQVTEAMIDDKIRRRLRAAFTLGWFDREQLDPSIPKDDVQSAQVALEGAREGLVLLKNDGDILPLDLARIRKVVVLGPNAHPAVTGGAGSSFTEPFRAVSVPDGLKNVGGEGLEVIRVPWENGSGRKTTTTPEGVTLVMNDAPRAMRLPVLPEGTESLLKSAEAVVVCVGFKDPTTGTAHREDPASEGEGADRHYELAPGQRELILEAARINPRTVVVLNAGGSVRTVDWISEAPVLLHVFYPGQEGGTAIAEIIFGRVNPSGKLPFTWEKQIEDIASHGNYPSQENRVNTYREGVFLGYRWFDTKGIAPLFPFGHGLSYTKFAYSSLKVEMNAEGNFTVSAKLRNIGSRAGEEVAQVYVQPPVCQVPRPAQELEGFAKLRLEPGETKEVRIPVKREDMAYWHPETRQWTLEPGEYVFRIGGSSRQLPLEMGVTVKRL